MKYIPNIKLSLGILTLFLVSSCNSSFLDIKPEGTPNSASYWQTETDAITASNGLYAKLLNDEMFSRGYFWFINASDDMVTGRVNTNANNIKNFVCNGNEGYIRPLWADKYQIIKGANDIINNVPNMKISTSLKNRVLGEAYFFSGWMYFDLAYHFGNAKMGIPIVDRANMMKFNIPRAASVVDNYKYIESELLKAAELLPYFDTYGTADYGRAHKNAAYAYLAKTYLYWAQYDATKYAKAQEYAEKVINSGKNALINTGNPAADFRGVFSAANNWSKEYIWSAMASTYTGSYLPGVMWENKGWGLYNGWGYFQPTKELFDEYEDKDARRDVTIFKEGTKFVYFGKDYTWTQTNNNLTGFMFGKYSEPFSDINRVNPDGDEPSTDLDVPLMRYAEVLLIDAEALIMQGKNGDVPLNLVRARAGLAPKTNATMADLKHERRVELAGEFADRHFDLVRWGDAADVYHKPLHARNGSIAWPARPQFDPNIHNVWPLPPNEIASSKGVLVQNAGW